MSLQMISNIGLWMKETGQCHLFLKKILPKAKLIIFDFPQILY